MISHITAIFHPDVGYEVGFEIPTIIMAIVFVVHLARSWYSRRHHPNYRAGTRYHCHFYHGLHSCSIFKGVVWRWRGERNTKYVRRNSTRRCATAFSLKLVSVSRAESGAEERFVAESICPRHMQARVAESAFYRGPWYYFPSEWLRAGRATPCILLLQFVCRTSCPITR